MHIVVWVPYPSIVDTTSGAVLTNILIPLKFILSRLARKRAGCPLWIRTSGAVLTDILIPLKFIMSRLAVRYMQGVDV